MRIFLPVILVCLAATATAQSFGFWKLTYAPGYRKMNGVHILDNSTFVMVGGNQFNDSIVSIVKTENTGAGWSQYFDSLGYPWLKAVHFANGSVGYATGDRGLVMKTSDGGVSWRVLPLTGNFVNRNYTSVFFTSVQTGFIAGGNASNDSIQTILKTTDGGNTWAPMHDVPGPWLKNIYFVDATTGFAVGEKGIVLKTTNGGNTWTPLTLTGSAAQRTYNAIRFANATTGIMVGGNQVNDSIQTILRTTDGGNNWSIICDSVGSWLTGISFADANLAYAVGDDGTLLTTNDKGVNWARVALPDSVNDKINLHAVHFLNKYVGVACGNFGKVLIYSIDTLPDVTVQNSKVLFNKSNEIEVTGIANNNGSPDSTLITFEYGATYALDDTAVLNINVIGGSSTYNLAVNLLNLTPNTRYYYRFKAFNLSGTYYSPIDSFMSTVRHDEILNWDFELWDTTVVDRPAGWVRRGYTNKVASFDGGNACEVKTYPNGRLADVGILISGMPSDDVVKGGTPFTVRADSVIAWFKYDFAAGDTGVFVVMFKKGGAAIATNIMHFWGNSSGSFERRSMPLVFPTADVPDTVILAVITADPFTGGEVFMQPTTKITIDKISFAGTTQNVPNADFEDWETDTMVMPTHWYNDNSPMGAVGYTYPLKKSTDSYHGQYALEIQNDTAWQRDGYILGLNDGHNNQYPQFALQHRPITFNGAFKYFPAPGDTLILSLNLFSSGVLEGYLQVICFDTVAQYRRFSQAITYNSNFSGIPDSASITIISGNNNIWPLYGSTRLLLDALTFDGNITPGYVVVVDTPVTVTAITPAFNFALFPNPANTTLHIRTSGEPGSTMYFDVMDLTGRLVSQTRAINTYTGGLTSISLQGYAPGVYLVSARGNDWMVTRKFIKVE